MANKAKVSSGFNKFLQKSGKAIAEARKAENTMQTCSMPVGWTGQAIITGIKADVSKEKKKSDGSVQAGKPYIMMDFEVVNDKKFAGSKFNNMWFFFDTENATAADRIEWCLNALENMGLPGELRRGEDTEIAELLEFFAKNDTVYDAEVVENDYSRDKKEVKVSLSEVVDDSDSVVPGGESESGSGGSLSVGDHVDYMDKKWEVTAVDGNDVTIKSPTSGRERTVEMEDLS